MKMTSKVVKYVEKRLKQEWSPEEISGRMEREIGTKVSHERIYQHVWMDKAQGGQLYQNLRIAGKKKRRKRRGIKDWRGKIPNRADIDERPKIVELKERFGDWEVNLVSGEHHHGFLVTLVERKSKFTLIGHVQRKTVAATCKEIIRLMKPYKHFYHQERTNFKLSKSITCCNDSSRMTLSAKTFLSFCNFRIFSSKESFTISR